MEKIIIILVISIISSVIFTGCVQKDIGQDEQEIGQEGLNEVENNLVSLAKEDLVNRLLTNVEDIKLIKIEKTKWRDSSLGYPESGKSYLPEEIAGYIIVLSYNNISYEYHSDYKRVVAPPEKIK